MMIANRFADRKRLAFTHKRLTATGSRRRRSFTSNRRPVSIYRADLPADKRKNHQRAETLILYMMALPHVTRIGDTTAGAFSSTTKHMPNGWMVDLSNEIIEAANGIIYEGKGIPPQFKVPVFDPENFYPA